MLLSVDRDETRRRADLIKTNWVDIPVGEIIWSQCNELFQLGWANQPYRPFWLKVSPTHYMHVGSGRVVDMSSGRSYAFLIETEDIPL